MCNPKSPTRKGPRNRVHNCLYLVHTERIWGGCGGQLGCCKAFSCSVALFCSQYLDAMWFLDLLTVRSWVGESHIIVMSSSGFQKRSYETLMKYFTRVSKEFVRVHRNSYEHINVLSPHVNGPWELHRNSYDILMKWTIRVS